MSGVGPNLMWMSHRSSAGRAWAIAAVLLAVWVVGLAVTGERNERAGTAPSPYATLAADAVPNATDPPSPPAETGGEAALSSPDPRNPALDLLDTIPAADSAALWYERSAFGSGWGDPDRNGCDARNDVLARDLVDVVYKPGTRDCVVASGTLRDPYTGRAIAFVRGNGTSQAVQIDHVVPLAWAWRYGASEWTDTDRAAFHSDARNLLAVDGPTNLQKSDHGPGRWLPPDPAAHCEYAETFVEVAAAYGLRMPDDDRAALAGVLARC